MEISKDLFQYAHSNRIINSLTKTKIRFTRGMFWMYFLKDILMFGVGFSVFAMTLRGVVIFGYDLSFLSGLTLYMYFVGPLVYLTGGYVTGYLDEHYGVWKAENAYSTVVLNPDGYEWMMGLIREVIRSELGTSNTLHTSNTENIECRK